MKLKIEIRWCVAIELRSRYTVCRSFGIEIEGDYLNILVCEMIEHGTRRIKGNTPLKGGTPANESDGKFLRGFEGVFLHI